jgi:uncharacterized repeat protein (TIGR02543 family)
MATGRFTRPVVQLLVGVIGALGFAWAAPPAAIASSPDVVISQVYGGGGNGGSTYKNDFIELHNRSNATVLLTGWSVQYASSGGTTWSKTNLSGSIAPGAYYLVQEAQGTGGTTNLPTPDVTGTIAMSATDGKVALSNTTTTLTGSCPTGGAVVDFVGFGSANCSESSAMAVLTNTTAGLRKSAGCVDSDNNASDFATGAPTPRNSAAATRTCQYGLTALASPFAGGSVAKSPDQPTYLDGASVQLTATAAVGYHFVNWSGDASGSTNPINVAMDADHNVTANFALDTHTLAVATAGNGTVGKSPDQPAYDFGTVVQLTATPAVGWHFVGWSGDASGSTNPLDVTMDADKNITATFAIDTHTLSVATVGSGTVGKSPDQPDYDFGSVVQLTATPAANWHFVNWSGDASGSTNPLDVTMNGDKNITATFAIDTHTLSVATVGSGTVGKSPDQPDYDFGTVVQLTATPAVGWHFVGWSGDASGSTNPLDVTMNGDKSITATFAIDTHTLAVATTGSGAVAKSPNQPDYDFGTVVQLTATPAANWHFVNWSGDASGSANPLDVTMDADKSITAHFGIDMHALTVNTVGSGTVGRVPDQAAYDDGAVVQLTATPAVGWHFVGWSGDASGSTNPLDITMNADKTITATFAIDTHTLSVATVGSGTVGKSPDQPTYDFGTVVQLTATPATGWHFVGWSGDASGSTNPLDVTMNADKSITATFAIDTHTLTVATVGNGTVGKSPDQPAYDFGTVVQLTASPASGWYFAGWSGDASGSTNPLSVTMDADKSITATFVQATVVVSQVYGGGGNSGATYTNDFIELFNRGSSAIDLTGWSVQYAAATGTTWSTTALSGSIAAGGYYLVQESQGAGGTTALPTPDATGNIPMNATAAKVALVSASAALSGSCPSSAIVDLVGYGAADCSETTPVGVLSNVHAALRNNGGCNDTNNNLADFTVAAPTPRNSATPTHTCLLTLTALVDPPAGGTVSKSPDQPAYAQNDVVQLTATPAFGYHFVAWSGDASGNANPLNVTMTLAKTVVAHFASNNLANGVVISQVYGGGGNIGSTYRQDYIELFNRGNTPVDITGWTVQYASATGGTWSTQTLIGTLQAGQYYLAREAQGSGGTLDVPTADATGTIAMSAIGGKVALVSSAGVLSGNCPSDLSIVDLVGYGSSDCSQGSPAPTLDNTTAAFRNQQGCSHLDNNALDFSSAGAAPRNSQSPTHLCDEWLAADPAQPTELALYPVSPNPSRGAARIAFTLPTAAKVRLQVLDLQGRLVETLMDGAQSAGRHEMVWKAATSGRAHSGMYYVRLEAGARRMVRSVLIVQ